MKNTKARIVILKAFRESHTPLTAEMLFSTLREKEEGINLSTVYRTLTTFEKNGLIKKEVSSVDRQAYYSLVEQEHYHILECVHCHKMIRIDYCPYEPVEKELEEKFGFRLDENSILYGTCKECQNKDK